MTDKNTLNNWFKTGAKPTQEQFWNWQDSYWHKTETIPQSQIQDLDTTLANKAEVSALEGKADKSAVYTIRQIDARLESKLNAPEDVFATPSHLIAMGERQERGAEGEAVIKLPISSIQGQNISSHYLTSVAGAGLQLGANWEIDTAGYYMKFKNLEDKTSSWSIHKRALVIDDNGIVGTKLLYPRINEDFGTTQFNSPNGNCYISDVLLKTNEYGSGLIKFKLHMHNFSFQGEVIQVFTRDNFKYYDILFPDGENEWNPIKSFDFPFYINNLLIIVTAILYKNGKFYVNNWNHHRVTTLVGGYYTVTDNLSII